MISTQSSPLERQEQSGRCELCPSYDSVRIYKPRKVDKPLQVNRPIYMCGRCVFSVNLFLTKTDSAWRMLAQPNKGTP